MKSYTLRAIADLFAAVDHHHDADRIHLQLRGLSARGLLTHIPDSYGPKGALKFNEIEVYRARVLIAAVDLGITKADLGKLKSQLDGAGFRSLKFAVAALGEAQWWVFEIARIREYGAGALNVACFWVVNGDRDGRAPPLAPPSEHDVYSMGGTIEAVVGIPFTALARPISAILAV